VDVVASLGARCANAQGAWHAVSARAAREWGMHSYLELRLSVGDLCMEGEGKITVSSAAGVKVRGERRTTGPRVLCIGGCLQRAGCVRE